MLGWNFHIEVQLYWNLNSKIMTYCRAYFRTAGHAQGMDKKGHFLVNLGKFEHKIPRNSMQI